MAVDDAVSPKRLKALVESLLFVAEEPLEVALLAAILEAEPSEVSEAIDALVADCRERGVRVQQVGHLVQMVTAPQAASYIERFLGMDHHQRLSTAALETLAIIAYRQPITRAAIEAIRGVDSDRVVATLMTRGLVEEIGRAETVGRPALLGTTVRFLEHFGLESPDQLPPLPTEYAESLSEAEQP
jgi:segregation and condensation protein B